MNHLITDIGHIHAELYCAFGLNHPDDFIQPEGARIARVAQQIVDFWLIMESCDADCKHYFETIKRQIWALENACKSDHPENKRVFEMVRIIMKMGEEIDRIKQLKQNESTPPDTQPITSLDLIRWETVNFVPSDDLKKRKI